MGVKVYPIRNIKPHTEGRGGTFDAVLAVATRGIVEANTYGGGSGTLDLTIEDFRSMVQNFPRRNGPVNTYWSHDTKGRRSRKSDEMPALKAATVQNVWVEGDQLWGTLDVGPKAWSAVIEERGVNSYSIEWGHNGENTQGEKYDGSYLDAGIFTNDSALDMQWQASAPDPDSNLRFSPPVAFGVATEEEIAMAKTLEQLQAENDTLVAKVKTFETNETKNADAIKALETRAKIAEDKATALEKKTADAPANERITALETANKDLAGKNSALSSAVEQMKNEAIVRDIKAIRDERVAAGVPPSKFEGLDKDPIAFLAKRGGTVEEFRALAATYDARPLGRRDVGNPAEGGATEPEALLHKETMKLASEKGIAYLAALDLMKDQKPEIYMAAVEARESKRARSIALQRGEQS